MPVQAGWRDLLGRRHVFVLAVKVVLSAELTGAGFVALLLAGPAVVASLRGSDLLAADLLLCRRALILAHVGARRVGADWLAILLAWGRWGVEALVVVRRADGVAVAVGDGSVGTVLRGHGPWTLVAAAMLHALGWRLGLCVGADADAGGPGGRDVGA